MNQYSSCLANFSQIIYDKICEFANKIQTGEKITTVDPDGRKNKGGFPEGQEEKDD